MSRKRRTWQAALPTFVLIAALIMLNKANNWRRHLAPGFSHANTEIVQQVPEENELGAKNFASNRTGLVASLLCHLSLIWWLLWHMKLKAPITKPSNTKQKAAITILFTSSKKGPSQPLCLVVCETHRSVAFLILVFKYNVLSLVILQFHHLWFSLSSCNSKFYHFPFSTSTSQNPDFHVSAFQLFDPLWT